MVTVLLPGGEDWLSTNEPSRFSREFKLEALRRMGAGENVSPGAGGFTQEHLSKA
jgi:hypothetical protein